MFSTMTKFHSFGQCNYWIEYIKDYSFSHFIDQNIYLDDIKNKCNFSSVLTHNMGIIIF